MNLDQTLLDEVFVYANAIAPGTVRTPIWDHRIERSPEILSELERWYPLRRIVEPAEVAKAALFLAGDDASANWVWSWYVQPRELAKCTESLID